MGTKVGRREGGRDYLEMPVGVIESYYQESIGQMVSLGSLKSQHLAKCLLSHCINQQLCQLPAYTLCSFCARRVIENRIYSRNNCLKLSLPPSAFPSGLKANACDGAASCCVKFLSEKELY